jgi:uncharacterized protein (TIGR03437 family)
MASLVLSSAGQPISGLQFDLTWDAALDVHVASANNIGAVGKSVYSASLQPQGLRLLIVGIAGMGALSDGELLRLFVTVRSAAAPGTAQVNLTNISATTPSGSSASVQSGPISVQIQNGSPTQPIPPNGVLNAASLAGGPISPGEIVTIFGSISSASPVVFFNGTPAPITYAGLDQVNVVVPYGLNPNNPALVEVQQGATTTQATVPVAAASPAIFALNATGTGSGAILNQDYSVNGPSNPAARGSALMIFATGFGKLNPLPVDGQITSTSATTASPVTATIEGIPAQVIYSGVAPGLIAGGVQINVVVPNGVSPNPAAPISLSMDSFTTPAGITVSIR